MLRSDLCDYSDAYIVVKEGIYLLVAAANENDKAKKKVAFKNNAPLDHDNPEDNVEDLDIVIPMLQYSQNCSMTSGIIIETKLMMLMIMLGMVNHLNI